jgi:hypothetical protein
LKINLKISILSLTAVICLASCKRSDPQPYEVASGSGFFGRFHATSYTLGGQTGTGAGTYAVFFNPGAGLFTPFDSARTVFVQNIACNGSDMNAIATGPGASQPFTEGYYQGTVENVAGGIRWDVNGDNGIPFFSWTDKGVFPDYFGQIPTTLTKASGITFNFSSSTVIGADTVFVTIDAKGGAVSKSDRVPCNISFTPQQLSAMVGDSAIVNISLSHHTIKEFSGLNFAFVQTRVISQVLPIY